VSPARHERIDMAVFGPLPGFARAAVRLRGIDATRGAAPAAALCRRAAAAAAAAPPPTGALWAAAYEVVGLPADTLPPHVALDAWARAPGGVPTQGPLLDLVHATALRHGVPAAAYDLAAVTGDLWLRPARGVELFAPPGAAPDAAPINELILADGADRVMARAWHGAQSADTRVGPGATEVLVHFDLLAEGEEAPAEAAAALAASFAQLATGFVGGAADVRVLTRAAPQAAWPA